MPKCLKNINWLILLFEGAYIVKLAIHQIYSFLNPQQTNYMYSNWLINYRGGFVRRGLAGEIILQLSSLFNIAPIYIIYSFTILTWIFLVFFFIFKFIKNKYPLFILVLPFFLGETIVLDSSHILRQDSLIILFFIAIMRLFFQKNLRSEILRFLTINILFILGILIHEVIFFLAFPILFISFWYERNSLVKSFLFFLPSTIVFMLCFMLPTKENVSNMLNLTPEINPYFVRFLNASFTENMTELWERITTTGLFFTLGYLLYLFITVVFVSVNFHKLRINLNDRPKVNSLFLLQILFFQFVAMLPVFCTAWDWGRWIFLWVTSSFAYFLSADENPFERTVLSKFDPAKIRFFEYLTKKPIVIFLVAILINCQFILPLQKDFFHNTPMFSVYCLAKNAFLYVKGLFF